MKEQPKRTAMRCAVRSSLAGLLLALAFTAAPSAGEQGEQRPGPQGPEEGALRRQLWLIPLPGEQLLMRASVLRPQGAGPFPLVVINHGSSQYLPRRENFPMPSYAIASQWFLDRGYAVVLPLRPGHGETGGPYFEDQGRCEVADYAKAGLAIADSIAAAVDYMTAQSFVQKSGAVVAGQQEASALTAAG